MKSFKENLFCYCLTCGWGEAGVHEQDIPFHKAYSIIENTSGKAMADLWALDEDKYFNFGEGGDYYMVAKDMFNESDWVGSEDY